MSRLSILIALAAVLAPVAAQAGDFVNFAAAQPWGRYYKMDPAKTHQLEVSVATNTKTGAQVNLVKLPNGHMMALVPAEPYLMMMSETPGADVMKP